MQYPKFLKRNSLIGITSPSSGVGNKLDSYELSISNLKKEFNVVETSSVRNNGYESNNPEIRGKEFNELLENKNVDMIFCASGGDFCISSLEYINFDLIKDNPLWIEGYSDPTSILYHITTKYDIATIGTMFNRIEDEYYVLLYSNKEDGTLLNSLLDSYRSKDEYVKTYYIDLDKKINSIALGDKLVKEPKNSNEVKVKGATLYKIKKAKVVECISSLEDIVKFLEG